ncbi:MAG: hypothetical protein HN368_16605 [Spirochaetales bacterium]|nr:hypothetical protein [Spirochaetales bacterium]
MNSRDRFIKALRNEIPDRVPVAPDISNMVPCRMTGKPFWDVYLHQDPPLWKANLDAQRYFGLDAWLSRGTLDFTIESTNEISHRIIEQREDRIVRETTIRNRLGTISNQTLYFRADSPWAASKWIKDPVKDIPCFIESLGTITGYTTETLGHLKREIGDEFALGFGGLRYPGFQYWVNIFDGALEQVLDVHLERPDLLEALRTAEHERNMTMLSHYLKHDPDYLFLGASGTITLASPDLFRTYGLPTLKSITASAAERDIPTLLHSCGRSVDLLRICAEETDLGAINPLEPPPMGDVDLSEVKKDFGGTLALMGNLHTTDVMLRGSKQDVIEAARKAIEDASGKGGFILSTGDQCGRDTPDENLFAMVEAAEKHGWYL